MDDHPLKKESFIAWLKSDRRWLEYYIGGLILGSFLHWNSISGEGWPMIILILLLSGAGYGLVTAYSMYRRQKKKPVVVENTGVSKSFYIIIISAGVLTFLFIIFWTFVYGVE